MSSSSPIIYFQIYEKDQYRPLDYFNNNTNKTDENYTILNYHYDGTNLSVEVKKDIKLQSIKVYILKKGLE